MAHRTEPSIEKHDRPLSVMGQRIPEFAPFTRTNTEKAIVMKLRSKDVVICHYPMSDNYWIYRCIWKLLHYRDPIPEEYLLWNAFHEANVEQLGTEAFDKLPSPRLLRSHLCYDLIPKHPEAKYIYLIRNPKDHLVSYHQSLERLSGRAWDFNTFFKDFMTGDIPYGSYFKHVKSWVENEQHNTLYLSYEEIFVNPNGFVRKVAEFLGVSYSTYVNLYPLSMNVILSSKENKISDFTLATCGYGEPKEYLLYEDYAFDLKEKRIVGISNGLLTVDQIDAIHDSTRSLVHVAESAGVNLFNKSFLFL